MDRMNMKMHANVNSFNIICISLFVFLFVTMGANDQHKSPGKLSEGFKSLTQSPIPIPFAFLPSVQIAYLCSSASFFFYLNIIYNFYVALFIQCYVLMSDYLILLCNLSQNKPENRLAQKKLAEEVTKLVHGSMSSYYTSLHLFNLND